MVSMLRGLRFAGFAGAWLGTGLLSTAFAQAPASPLSPPSAFPSSASLAPSVSRYAPPASVVPVQFAEPFSQPMPPAVQDVDAVDAAPDRPAALLAAAPGDASTPSADLQLSQAELLQRLQQTEARLKQLESHSAPLKDPKTATMLEALREKWDTAKDPSITTVDQQTHDSSKKKASEKKWYDRLSIRGYTQLRLSESLNTAAGSAPPQTVLDRSISDDQEFLLRRARLIISGDVSDHMYVYLQSEFAQTPTGSPDNIHFAQIRDWYADLYLDNCKVNRIRVGQSKVPYGWDTLQSSSNRIPFERSDAINTAVRNERDLGVFYYWTPEGAQDFFKFVLDEGLKGSGNYGVFGMGVYNGQGGSFTEQNDNLHFVSRLTIPHQFANGQCMEVGVQGYIGQYGVIGQSISPLGVGGAVIPAGTVSSAIPDRDIRDQRVAGSFIWYPQPIGFQAEWNVGRGPALNDAQTLVEDRPLHGGYIQSMIKIDTPRRGTFFPYIRYVTYEGGYKAERNAPFANIDEWEMGTEWQINPQMEFTMAYMLTDRTNTNAISTANTLSYRQYDGDVLRFQFQFNY